jgi:hypothetical protein
MATYSYPENVTKALKENGLNKDSLWDCHGTWVLKHSACETIAANKGITFDEPVIIESDADKSIAIVMVKGYLGDKFEWTFGEATPKNSKNSYPYAMAEKRAKDRIILKLIGLHGDVYSEDEADVFKDEIAAQEKLDKRVEQERVDTSVYGKVGKKKATEEIKKLTPLFAKFQSDDKKMSDEALKDAKGINEWAKKHNLSIVQEKYYKLFERQKSA